MTKIKSSLYRPLFLPHTATSVLSIHFILQIFIIKSAQCYHHMWLMQSKTIFFMYNHALVIQDLRSKNWKYFTWRCKCIFYTENIYNMWAIIITMRMINDPALDLTHQSYRSIVIYRSSSSNLYSTIIICAHLVKQDHF